MAVRASKPASPTPARAAANSGPYRGRIAREDPQGAIRAAMRRRRRMRGLSQQHAAAQLGLSRLTYHRIETGRRRIRTAELAAICTVYNCPVGELVKDAALAQAFIRAATGA
jgi:DNA-binding Xre family transcriptional regulator